MVCRPFGFKFLQDRSFVVSGFETYGSSLTFACDDSLNKPKPSAAETSLLVSIVEAPVYAMQSQY